MDALPSLPTLTPDDRVWRLDWFGECAYPGGVRRYAQPSIKISLSALRCDPSDHAALLLPDSTDHQHPHEAWVPVAALPILAIGDLWQHGHQVASPGYQKESFKGLRITHETTAFVKAGLAIDEYFLLPLSYHPWHRPHTQSYCIAVAMADGHRLLVPCLELIRFYFGSSSNFLQRLFTYPLAAAALWTSKRFNQTNRHLHLVLASRLSGASAADIGRIAESQFAWRSAAGIHASCQKASVQRHPAYPYTGFPFEGVTNLVASGIWLPFGNQECATFLAYRLHSCSHPFPFKSLSYEAADRKAWHDSAGGRNSEGGGFSGGRKKAKPETVDSDPGANKTQRSTFFRSQHRFPDLARKQLWREKLEAMPKADVFLRKADGRLETVALGESDGFSTVAGLDVSQDSADYDNSEASVSLPRFVDQGLKLIAEGLEHVPSGAEIKVVCPAGKIAPVFSLPVVIDEDGEIASKLLFTAETGSVRQRRACFVEVSQKANKRFHFLVIEGQTRSAQSVVMSVTNPVMADAILSILPHEGCQGFPRAGKG